MGMKDVSDVHHRPNKGCAAHATIITVHCVSRNTNVKTQSALEALKIL